MTKYICVPSQKCAMAHFCDGTHILLSRMSNNGEGDMSNEIDKVANDDNRELAITNIKKSPYLTRQGKEVAMNIISDTTLHEARKRSENHMNKIKVETAWP